MAEEGAARAGRRALAQALPRLEGDALEAVQLAALLDDALTPALLAPLLVDPSDPATSPAEARHRAGVALEQLVDLGLLRGSPSGAVWRHPALQDTVRAWVRPAVAQRLHRLVAGRAPLPSARRVQHWLAAGERALACVAAMDAAEECTARDDPAGARTHLLQVCSLGDLPEASPTDRADLYEALGDASTQLRRPQEARSAYRQALDVARAERLPTADRLAHKLEAASDPRSLDVVPAQDSDATSALSGFGALAGAMGDPDRLERYLLDALELADRRGDAKRSVEVRLQLAAGVALPRRDFLGVHRWVEAASALATRPTDRLRGVLVRHVTPVLLGGAASSREALDDPAVVAAADPGTPVWWRLASMRLLVAHDLGLPGVEDLLRQLEQRVADGGSEDLVPELAAVCLRVRAEREETDRAAAMAAHLSGPAVLRTSPLRQHLARLGVAELHEVDGDHRQAVELLRAVVDEGLAKGCTLLVPEAAARLVLLEAEHDRDAARAAFEVFDDVVGAKVGGPREEFWRRLSRAAVRAGGGDHDGAVAACEQASQLAGQHGLQVLAARARRQRAGYLRRRPRPHPLVDVR